MLKKIVTYEEVEISKELRKKCIEYLENNKMEMYIDYRDQLSVEQAQKIIDGKLFEIQDEIWENSIDNIYDMEIEQMKNMKNKIDGLDEFEDHVLREEFLDYLGVDMNMKQILNNTTVRMRIVLHSNFEGFSAVGQEGMKDDYIKQVYRLLTNYIDRDSFKQEVLNSMCLTQFIFYGNVNLGDIYKYDFKDWKKITIQPDCMCGLFDTWNGSGSTLEVKLNKPITVKRQYGETEYDNVSILIDEANKYSVEEVYGLCGVNDLDFKLK